MNKTSKTMYPNAEKSHQCVRVISTKDCIPVQITHKNIWRSLQYLYQPSGGTFQGGPSREGHSGGDIQRRHKGHNGGPRVELRKG